MLGKRSLKQVLSEWYHADTLGKTALGAFAKLVFEGGFWFLVLYGLVALGILLPLPFADNIKLFSTEYWVTATGLGASATLAKFCMFTKEPTKFN